MEFFSSLRRPGGEGTVLHKEVHQRGEFFLDLQGGSFPPLSPPMPRYGPNAGEVSARVDRRLKDKFLDELRGQAYDLLQLLGDRILTNRFWIHLSGGDVPPPPQELPACRQIAEEPKESLSPETTAALLQPHED